MEVFTTGRGTPYGLAMAPVIKVSTRTALAERWHDLIDVDAGRIATGEATIEDIGGSALYLLSDLSRGVTGEIHFVDAGYNITSLPTLERLRKADVE